jgi:hypothetical protein
MLLTKEETVKVDSEYDDLTFYEKIKIKNNIESIFNHYTGSYVFIEMNPWSSVYTIRGKFHVKYGIFSKFEINFDKIGRLREYSEFIESLAFLKNTCEEDITPILNCENELSFLHNGEYIKEENINFLLENIKDSKKSELFNINEEIKMLYSHIEEIDNDIKYRKEQIKNMELKIREVKEAASGFFSALKYITLTKQKTIINKLRNMFVKEQLRLK